MKTSTVDMVSETAVEFKSYMCLYSPYLDDGISSETSTASIHTAGKGMVHTALTGVTQQVEMRGRCNGRILSFFILSYQRIYLI